MLPAEKLRILSSRTSGLWRVIKLFRDVGHRGIPATVDYVREQTSRILEALDQTTRSVSEINQPGYAEKMLSDASHSASSAARSAIEKTSIVLGHSILDDVLTECCRISAMLMPESWVILVQDRKVTLAEALRTPPAEIEKGCSGNVNKKLWV